MSEQVSELSNNQLKPDEVLAVGAEFLNHFGVEADPLAQPAEFAEAMEQLDPRYQGGRNRVRYELEADQTAWDEETRGVIARAAEGMRMLEPETPLQGKFDAVIVLGGARQANLDRALFAAQAAKEGTADVGQVIVVGTSRKLKDDERWIVTNYAPGAKTEFDLCAAAAARVARELPGTAVSMLYVEDEKAGTPVVIEEVLSALQTNGSLNDGARVAAVTTQIYQASTQLDLERVARQFGINEVTTAGNPSDPNIVAKRTPATYLSETLRTLKAAANAAQAERQAKAAHAERARRIVEAATGSDEAVLADYEDGSRLVRSADGSRYVIESDGSRWTQYNAASGLRYDGPGDSAGIQSE